MPRLVRREALELHHTPSQTWREAGLLTFLVDPLQYFCRKASEMATVCMLPLPNTSFTPFICFKALSTAPLHAAQVIPSTLSSADHRPRVPSSVAPICGQPITDGVAMARAESLSQTRELGPS